MKTFQQFLEKTDIDSAREVAKKRALQDMKDREKRANEDRKRSDRAASAARMQDNIQKNTETSSNNSARLDALENPRDDSTPGADAVGGAIKGVANKLAQRGQEVKQQQMQKKQLQNKQKMMNKQHQLEKQKMQMMKKSV